MILRNFIATLRRYKVSSVLNIAGLSIAFTALYFLTVQVKYDLSYNSELEDSENLYGVFTAASKESTQVQNYLPRVLMEDVAKCTPLIEEIAPTPSYSSDARYSIVGKEDDKIITLNYGYGGANNKTFELLGYNIIEGSLTDFDNPEPLTMAVVSNSAAKANNIKVGDQLQTIGGNKSKTTIVAIFEDRAANTSFSNIDIIPNIGEDKNPTLQMWSNTYIIKPAKDVTIEQLNTIASEQINNTLIERFPSLFNKNNLHPDQLRTSYIPLSEIYYNETLEDFSVFEQGDITYTIMLIVIGVIIIVIALMNFVNFFFALMPVRICSINICKVYGGSTLGLRINFIFETLLMIMLSLVLSLAIIYVAWDMQISKFFTAPIAINENWIVVGIMAVFAVIIAILVSLYPSYKITSYPATLTLKGNFGATKQGKALRYGLLALQLVVSIILISVVLFFNLQLSYVKNKDLGFNSQNLLILKNDNSLVYKENNKTLRDEILSINGVQGVTYLHSDLVNNRLGDNTQLINGIKERIKTIYVAPNFLEFIGIELLKGRDLYPSDEIHKSGERLRAIFSELAAQRFNLTLDGEDEFDINSYDVVGVCKDINNFTLDSPIVPMSYTIPRGDYPWCGRNYIRYEKGADVEAIVSEIRKLVCELDENESIGSVQIQKFEDHIEQLYSAESDLVEKIAIFTLISIVISLMGIFGLVYFDIQHKRKEIAIRRVFGATVSSILRSINKTYLIITAICFAIATPVSYYIVDSYLSTFAYHTPIYWWVFILVLIAVLAMITAIVTISSHRTANTNPNITMK